MPPPSVLSPPSITQSEIVGDAPLITTPPPVGPVPPWIVKPLIDAEDVNTTVGVLPAELSIVVSPAPFVPTRLTNFTPKSMSST